MGTQRPDALPVDEGSGDIVKTDIRRKLRWFPPDPDLLGAWHVLQYDEAQGDFVWLGAYAEFNQRDALDAVMFRPTLRESIGRLMQP